MSPKNIIYIFKLYYPCKKINKYILAKILCSMKIKIWQYLIKLYELN